MVFKTLQISESREHKVNSSAYAVREYNFEEHLDRIVVEVFDHSPYPEDFHFRASPTTKDEIRELLREEERRLRKTLSDVCEMASLLNNLPVDIRRAD